jgi:hypothetical protein
MLLTEDVKAPLDASVRPISVVYSELKEKNALEVSYVRMPIADERSPGLNEFDGLVHVLSKVDAQTAVYFNCQMGKGRTTTGSFGFVLFGLVLFCLFVALQHSTAQSGGKRERKIGAKNRGDSSKTPRKQLETGFLCCVVLCFGVLFGSLVGSLVGWWLVGSRYGDSSVNASCIGCVSQRARTSGLQ